MGGKRRQNCCSSPRQDSVCVCIGKLLLETNKYLLLYVSRHAAGGTKLITPPANPLGAHPRGGLGLGDASGLCDFSFAGSRTERQASAGTQTPSFRRRKRTSPERIFHFVPSCPNAILSVARLDADAFLSFGAFPVADRLLPCTVAERLGDFASSHAAFKRRRGKKQLLPSASFSEAFFVFLLFRTLHSRVSYLESLLLYSAPNGMHR